LRDYATGHPAEVGSEATPAEFLAALWAATAEIKRVLKPTGSAFINLGDKYSGNATGAQWTERTLPWNGQTTDGRTANYSYGARNAGKTRPRYEAGVREKSLLLLPEAYRLGCTGMLATLGGPDPGLNLIARAVIVQDKRNPLPESATDRVRRSHEDWVHLTKSPKYYSALDELREPYLHPNHARPNQAQTKRDDIDPTLGKTSILRNGYTEPPNPLGKLPGSVWPIASEPLDLPDYLVRLPTGVTMMDAGPLWRHVAWMRATGQPGPVIVRELDHYAAFPSELPRRLILGFSPPGICVDCGHGRFPVVDRKYVQRQHDRPGTRAERNPDNNRNDGALPFGSSALTEATILGYACACTPSTLHPGTGGRERTGQGYAEATGRDAHPHGGVGMLPRTGPWREYHLNRWKAPPARPAVVLDTFCGAGTAPMVAAALGRIGIGVELGADYCLAARWRIRHSRRVAKTLERTNRERQTSLDLSSP
jgi:DNA modification methylase